LVRADPKTAEDWYKEGANQYNLGNFDKAVDAFKQGFELETNENKKPAYLYNVAQAYRQEGKCKEAVFFYKRFLALKQDVKASTRDKVEKLIAEADDCEKKQEALAQQPPQDTLHPDDKSGPGDTGTGADSGSGSAAPTTPAPKQIADKNDGDDDEGADQGVEKSTTTSAAPKVISARLFAGAAKISAGSLEFPVQPTFTLIAGYPLAIGNALEIDLGAAIAFTPVPFTNTITNANRSASFFSVLANAGATYTVASKIGVRADVGVGALVFSGIDEMGNPFTEGGAPTSGALAMFAVRAGVSAEYAVTPNLAVTVAPITFSYSPPKQGLRMDIKSIDRLDFMVGVGYRM
jgi:tetratricopeptide (TPR) repeat protein